MKTPIARIFGNEAVGNLPQLGDVAMQESDAKDAVFRSRADLTPNRLQLRRNTRNSKEWSGADLWPAEIWMRFSVRWRLPLQMPPRACLLAV